MVAARADHSVEQKASWMVGPKVAQLVCKKGGK